MSELGATWNADASVATVRANGAMRIAKDILNKYENKCDCGVMRMACEIILNAINEAEAEGVKVG